MRRFAWPSRFYVLLACAAALLSSPAVAATIKLAPTSFKVARSYSGNMLTDQIALRSARGEFEGFQIVFDAGAANTTGVRFELTLTHTTKPTVSIPSDSVRYYRLEYLGALTNSSSSDVALGEDWADPMIPLGYEGLVLKPGSAGNPFVQEPWNGPAIAEVPLNSRGLFFVEIFVPPGQEPGRYVGSIVVEWTDGTPQSVTKTLSLEVNPFVLPLTSSLPTTVPLTVDNICRAHGDVDSSGFCNDQHPWAWLYGRFLLEHRLTPSLPHGPILQGSGAVDEGLSAQHYAAWYGDLLNGTDPDLPLRNAAGKSARATTVNYPWWISEYDHYAEVFLGANASNGPRVQAWQNVIWNHLTLTSAQRRTMAYLDDDEPGSFKERWKYVDSVAAALGTATPPLRHLVTTDIDTYGLNGGVASEKIDILTPMLLHLDDDPLAAPHYATGNRRSDYDPQVEQKTFNEVWGYQSCNSHNCGGDMVNRPNLMVDATGVQNRSDPWMQFIYKTSGMLYFAVAQKLTTAWKPGDGLWDFGGNGDGTLLYPGTPVAVGTHGRATTADNAHIPIASHRLKLLREGLEDYEYLIACDGVDPARARRLASDPASGLFTRVAGTDDFPHGSMFRTNNAVLSPQTSVVGVRSPRDMALALDTVRAELLACIDQGGAGRDPDWQDDPTVVSPPVLIGPVLTCAPSTPTPSSTMEVGVAGTSAGATIELYAGVPPPLGTPVTGTPIATQSMTATSGFLTIPTMASGTALFARQVKFGHPSFASNGVTVSAITAATSVVRPLLHYYDFHTCGVAAMTSRNLPGAPVTVFESTVGWATETALTPPATASAPNQFIDFFHPALPLQKDRWIAATQTACGFTSDIYAHQITDHPDATLSTPTLQDCDVYGEASQCVQVGNLQPGAMFTVTAATTPVTIITRPAFSESEWVKASVPDGTNFTASQVLCAGGPGGASLTTGSFEPVRKPCSDMPAPRFQKPVVGDTSIVIQSHVQDARFTVFAGSAGAEKVGGSSETTVPLTRALVDGDFLRVFQETDFCRGEQYFSLRVTSPSGL